MLLVDKTKSLSRRLIIPAIQDESDDYESRNNCKSENNFAEDGFNIIVHETGYHTACQKDLSDLEGKLRQIVSLLVVEHAVSPLIGLNPARRGHKNTRAVILM